MTALNCRIREGKQHHSLLTSGCAWSTGAKFVPTPEERLLSVVHALLHRCYKLPFSNAATVTQARPLHMRSVCLRFQLATKMPS